MFAASLVVFAALATTGRGATYAVMTSGPLLVVVLAVVIRRAASGVPRAVCLVIAVIGAAQLVLLALYSTVWSTPSGVEVAVLPLALGVLNTMLSFIVLVVTAVGRDRDS